MLIVAIMCIILGFVVDYVNTRFVTVEIAAMWLYSASALSWVDVLGIKQMSGMFHSPIIRFGLWSACILITFALMSSMLLRPLPIVRKLFVPVSDSMLGLGTVGQREINQRALGFIVAAAVLSSFAAGDSASFVAAAHVPVNALGAYVGQHIGVEWIGYGK
jgi:hypothetical protein